MENFKETPEQTATTRFDRAALESRLKESRPFEAGAPSQMADTPIHTQGDQPDCLLQSARMAEHKQTGLDPGLEAYKQPAVEQGLYDRAHGTDMQKFVDVINERPGMEAQLKYADGPQDIKDALDKGQSVIGGVDAYEFYKGQYNLEPNSGGHAVVVTGAEQAPDGSWDFRVNDPNFDTPNMGSKNFLPAWDAANRPMITMQKTGGA